ncbi:hypothetical protein B0H10DRAFT_878818 [Mycena sp. CBHHK59/15]|nr:hypothetical protein B0H10DRAFT_878818 [Mycena sp. CBHHK59/15]
MSMAVMSGSRLLRSRWIKSWSRFGSAHQPTGRLRHGSRTRFTSPARQHRPPPPPLQTNSLRHHPHHAPHRAALHDRRTPACARLHVGVQRGCVRVWVDRVGQDVHALRHARGAGHNPARAARRVPVHPRDAGARIPPAMQLPRDLQRDNPRPARARRCREGRRDPGRRRGRGRRAHRAARGGRYEPCERARGAAPRGGQPPHGEHGLERAQQPQSLGVSRGVREPREGRSEQRERRRRAVDNSECEWQADTWLWGPADAWRGRPAAAGERGKERPDFSTGQFIEASLTLLFYSMFSFQSLLNLAGSEKATSDKERTREGRYINTRYIYFSLLLHVYSLTHTPQSPYPLHSDLNARGERCQG